MRYLIIIYTLLGFILLGCSNKHLPEELELGNKVYAEQVSYTHGPGGLNRSFSIYELTSKVIHQINSEGLSFLKQMPSIQKKIINPKGPYKNVFGNWKKLPLIRKEHNPDNPDEFLDTYYGKRNHDFVKKIKDPHLLNFINIINSNQGYYSYGGYRDMEILILSTKHQQAYHLFRD